MQLQDEDDMGPRRFRPAAGRHHRPPVAAVLGFAMFVSDRLGLLFVHGSRPAHC
jgi:hypothetical protein